MSPFLLAWSNLTQQRIRTLISLVGVGFAVLLVFMQLGFLDAVLRTASLLYDQLQFDLLIASREYISLAKPSTFSRSRLAQAQASHGVETVEPLTVMLGQWRDPRPTRGDVEAPRLAWSILILAVEPGRLDHLFRKPIGTIFRDADEMSRARADLARLDTVLIDRTSRAEYGDLKTWKRTPRNELNRQQVEIVGDIKIGTGFAYNGLLMTSEATLSRLAGWPADRVSFGLVRLQPGTNPLYARERLRSLLPDDVEVYTRAAINKKEEKFWLTQTAVGSFFVVGVVIALMVGGVFVYQMMAADITRRLAEYATIRALGYQGRFLSAVVFWQGLLLALCGYVPGLVAALVCYWATATAAGIPISMTALRATGVLGLTLIMCMGSALVAVRGVHRANPADLF
jgi:putative ABC transport system permease protein